MENKQTVYTNTKIDDSFMKSWIPQTISIPNGLFHLSCDGKWGCIFVSDKCLEVLDCSKTDFLEILQGLSLLSLVSLPEKTVGMLLEKIKRTQESCSFIGVAHKEAGEDVYIRGTLAVSVSVDGRLRVYGQITDMSKAQKKEIYYQEMEEKYQSSRQIAEKLKEEEEIFKIVSQHSNRILYTYDLKTRTTRPWDRDNEKKDILSHLYGNRYSDDEVENNQFILPDSVEDVKQFFADIHSGVPTGEAKLHVKLADGETRWFHFRYSSLFDQDEPETALISIEDVTRQHEYEITYQRYVQSLEGDAEHHLICMESDLTDDRIENLAGHSLSDEDRNIQCSYTEFRRLIEKKKFQFEERIQAAYYFSREHLLDLYAKGEKKLKREWKVFFNDETLHWLNIEIMLTADPYNHHVKAFFRMLDITEERKKHLSILQRADFDAMTGLLRRGVGEERIKAHLSMNQEEGGVLIALDLDDLKGINDSLGHKQGDAAIIGIANILKSHFRKDDILVRAGGDEFIVFLPGAWKSIDSVELSMKSLLRKLSTISIGENGERTIHCSAGCAVEIPGKDSFDTLFKRADMALYHVKRNGKNNFVFYEPEMANEDYKFRLNQAIPIISESIKEEELQHLLEIVAADFPGIVLFNLSKNYFKILSIGSNVVKSIPSSTIDIFWQNWLINIHPEDLLEAVGTLSRASLLSIYEQGQRGMKYYYRNREEMGYMRTQVSVQFYRTEAGDICAFLFFRWKTDMADKQ